jgi:hypothetical protein
LRFVDRSQLHDCLEFEYDLVGDDHVKPIATVEKDAAITDGHCLLPLKLYPSWQSAIS